MMDLEVREVLVVLLALVIAVIGMDLGRALERRASRREALALGTNVGVGVGAAVAMALQWQQLHALCPACEDMAEFDPFEGGDGCTEADADDAIQWGRMAEEPTGVPGGNGRA